MLFFCMNILLTIIFVDCFDNGMFLLLIVHVATILDPCNADPGFISL